MNHLVADRIGVPHVFAEGTGWVFVVALARGLRLERIEAIAMGRLLKSAIARMRS